MRVKVLLGAFAAFLAASVSVGAQSTADTAGAPPNIPTVTIINKGATPAEPAPPMLTVSPAAPETPAAPAAPARAAEPAAPGPAPTSAPAAVRSATIEAAQPAADEEPLSAQTPAAETEKVLAVPAPSPAMRPVAPKGSAREDAASAEPPLPPPQPTLVINIDLTGQVMTVSEHGELKYTWKVSSARYGHRTPTGTFQPTWMSKMWYSRQYDYAPMPHAIFFNKGVAIHATYATGMLGRPASHGCVRLAPRNAATLYKLVNEHGKARTEIVVHGTPDHSSEEIASEDYGQAPMRRGQYRYLPPGYASRGYYSAYDGPPPGYYYAQPRKRRYYATPRQYYQPRGLFNSYSYGYGF